MSVPISASADLGGEHLEKIVNDRWARAGCPGLHPRWRGEGSQSTPFLQHMVQFGVPGLSPARGDPLELGAGWLH